MPLDVCVLDRSRNILRSLWVKASRSKLVRFATMVCILTPAIATAQHAIPTFESLGLYWKPPGSGDCQVRFREPGGFWRQALDMWYVSDDQECRGSLVHLQPDTQYEVEMSQGGKTANITARTWSEAFPIRETVDLSSQGSEYQITRGGTADGYVLYTGPATIGGSGKCMDIRASFVIIRGVTCKGTIKIDKAVDVHDIVIEESDISGWGNSYAASKKDYTAAIWTNNKLLKRLIIQRNKIHGPIAGPSGSAKAGSMGVHFREPAGQLVVRYNEFYSPGARMWDPIGGAQNMHEPGVAHDSDFYGNYIRDCQDDCVELEGGGRNMRVWGNFTRDGFVHFALATINVGPTYVWRNVSTKSIQTYTECCGWLKVGGNKHERGHGRIYVFHNTMFNNRGVIGWGGSIRAVTTRNNIFDGKISERDCYREENDFDYDLYSNGIKERCGPHEAHGIEGEPTFSSPPTADPQRNGGAGTFILSSASKGYDAGQRIPNFSEDYEGKNPDMGAHEAGTSPMEFGVDAYRGEVWGSRRGPLKRPRAPRSIKLRRTP